MAKNRSKTTQAPNAARQTITPQQAQYWFDVGMKAHQQGDLIKARDQYAKVLVHYPQHADALHLTGVIACQVGQYEKAEDIIKRAIDVFPKAAIYYNSLGGVYRWKQEYELAKENFSKAIQMKPDFAEAINNLGVAEKETGNFEKAEELYTRAIALTENYADAIANIGSLHLARGQMEEARRDTEKAIALNPNHAEAQYNYGLLNRLEGKNMEAGQALEKAVNIKPNYVNAYLELGRVLDDMGSYDQSARCYEEALKYEPASAKVKNSKAQSLMHQNNAEEAEALLTSLVDTEAANPMTYTVLGTAKRARGDLEGAVEMFKKALELAPNLPAAYQGLAQTEKMSGLDEERVQQLRQRLDSEQTNPKQKSALHFSLGKIFDDAEHYDDAFTHFTQGNDLAKVEYDPKKEEERVDALIETYSKEFFESFEPRGDDSEQPVFIVGMPRSGTTLTEQIVASHGRVYGAGELSYFPQAAAIRIRQLTGGLPHPEGVKELKPQALANLAKGFLSPLEEKAGDALRITDKMPANTFNLGLVALVFPNARVIHCQRNPLDTCLSCFFQNFRVGQSFSYNLENLGHYYRQYLRLMAHWRETLPLRLYESKYEALVENQEAESRKLIDFVGLEWDDHCLEFYENSRSIYTASVWQVRQPIYSSSKERWRNYDRHIAPLKQAIGWDDQQSLVH